MSLKIEFQEVSFKDPTTEHLILSGINLKVYAHDFLVIIGGNGSGKTSLMNLILGLKKPTMGTFQKAFKINIATINQDLNKTTFSELSVYENLLLATSHNEGYKFYFQFKNDKEKMTELLSKWNLNLHEKLDQKVGDLSGGQRQALGLCMAFLKKPELLLLDEHTSALDPVMANHLMQWTFEQTRKHKVAVVMVTHNLQDALKYATRLVVMKKGGIALELSKEQLANFKEQDLLSYY